MNPATHLLASWFLADFGRLGRRDRIVVALSGALPDLDGLGMIPDLVSRAAGGEATFYYDRYHHSLLHGIAAVAVFAAISLVAAKNRVRAVLLTVAAVHVHLLMDLVGSRGPTPQDIWPITYLAPFSDRLTLAVPWQWRLDGWQNILLSVILIGMVLHRAASGGPTPVELLGRGRERQFVEAVRRRWALERKGSSAAPEP
jgi:hypothetical protein